MIDCIFLGVPPPCAILVGCSEMGFASAHGGVGLSLQAPCQFPSLPLRSPLVWLFAFFNRSRSVSRSYGCLLSSTAPAPFPTPYLIRGLSVQSLTRSSAQFFTTHFKRIANVDGVWNRPFTIWALHLISACKHLKNCLIPYGYCLNCSDAHTVHHQFSMLLVL